MGKYSFGFFGFFLGILGLEREPPLLAGSGRGAGLGRVRAGGDAPRGCTPDWRTSAPSTDRGRVSRRGSRARRSAGLFGVWGKTRPSFRGSSSSTRREGSRAGSRATRRTVLPRRSRGMRGGRTGGVEVRGGGGGSEGMLGGGASPLRTPGAVPSTFARARRGRTPVFRSAQLAPDEWTRGFELAGPVSTGRPRDESQASPDERTPGNFPDTSKLTSFLAPRRDKFSVQFPPHASNRRGGASDVSRWPRGMDTTHPTAHENASIVPRGTLPTRPRPAPSRSDGRRWRGCPATVVRIATRPRHHRGRSAVRTRALRRAGADVPPRGRS